MSSPENQVTQADMELMRKHLRFVMDEESSDDDEREPAAVGEDGKPRQPRPRSTPEQRMAKKYFRKLYKEYCLCDMSGYREGRIGMRWRTEEEVLLGKGQFICGNLSCSVVDEGVALPPSQYTRPQESDSQPRRSRSLSRHRRRRHSSSDSDNDSDSGGSGRSGARGSVRDHRNHRKGPRRRSRGRSRSPRKRDKKRSRRRRSRSPDSPESEQSAAVATAAGESRTGRLLSFEVNFAYPEDGQIKQTLVKCRLCKLCAYKLNYRKIKQLELEGRHHSSVRDGR